LTVATIWPALVLAAITAGQGPKSVDPICERILPAAAASRLTGRSDLILIPRRSIPTAGGTCNYATPLKRMVLLVTVLNEKARAAEHYARYKERPEYRQKQKDVPGLGDEAFTGGAYEHQVVVRKGSRIVLVASMIQMDRPTRSSRAAVPREQLLAVAREVVGKL
jgi:hypothetical protein